MGVLKWLCLCVCPPGFPRSPVGKVRLQCDAGDAVRPLGREDPLERERAAGTGVLAWETPLTGRLAGYRPRGRRVDTTEPLTRQRQPTSTQAHIPEKTVKLAFKDVGKI